MQSDNSIFRYLNVLDLFINSGYKIVFPEKPCLELSSSQQGILAEDIMGTNITKTEETRSPVDFVSLTNLHSKKTEVLVNSSFKKIRRKVWQLEQIK